jgi:alpha-mannosidase
MIKRCFFIIALLLLKDAYAQQPLKHLYLGNDTHTDLLWNGTEDDWYKWNLDMAKFYLKLGEETASNPVETRSKWNYDVAWTLYTMDKREPKEFVDRVIKQIKNGQASVPINFTLPVYGGSTTESVLRSFYPAGQLARKYGIVTDMAICQENATLPLGIASLWAGSGAKYSWKGVCNCATKINTTGPREHEIYWQTGLDGSKILLKWYSNSGWNAELGGYAEMLEPTVAVQQMEKLCGSENYPYLIAGAFGKGWDNIHNYSLDLQWGVGHRTLPGTKVYLSNQEDFFRHFERDYGNQLPEVAAAYGNEWELGMASLAEVSGKLKRSMEKLRTAEALAAVVPNGYELVQNLATEKEAFLYGLGMYSVHGWTADGPISRKQFADYMRKFQNDITTYVDKLYDSSLDRLAESIDKGNAENTIVVFNALNWERSGIIDIELNGDWNALKNPETGEIHSGIILDQENKKMLRVKVNGIPSVGYQVFELVKINPAKSQNPFKFSGNKLETPFYSVKFAKNGALASLYDKQLKKEWAAGSLNSLGDTLAENTSSIKVVTQGPDFIEIICRAPKPLLHESKYTFYAENRRVDINNTLLANFGNTLHFIFPFAITNPEVWHEEVGAVIKAKTIENGGHYANKMARYDYLSLNHFLNVGNQSENITVSNLDCQFFKLGNSTPTQLDMGSSVVHILAGGTINANLGVFDQDGDSLFQQHFALLPGEGAHNETASMKMALEHQNPLAITQVKGGGTLKSIRVSFLTITNPNVLLWALKPAETNGITIRLWNMAIIPVQTTVLMRNTIEKALHTTHIETDIAEVPVVDNLFTPEFSQNQLKTYRILLSKTK